MKSSSIFLFLLLVVFSNCQKTEPSVVTGSQPVASYDEIVAIAESAGISLSQIGLIRNWQEVLAVAADYGLEDEFRDQESKHMELMFASEEQLHVRFEAEKQALESRRQRAVYMDKGQHIQCLSDYFKLMDSLPLYRRSRYPSDEAYAALKKEYFSSDYKFFINESTYGPHNLTMPFLTVLDKPGKEIPVERKVRQIANR